MITKHTRLALASVLPILSIGLASAMGNTLHVDPGNPSSFASIQEAIDAAWDFDTIVVHPGLYRDQHINYHGAMVTITGTDSNAPAVVESTIIDAGGTGSVVMFRNSEGPYSVLRGLTIRNGQNGIECIGADTTPLIVKCRVISNGAVGIACSLAKPTITETILENNKTAGISGSLGEISLCRISSNGSGKDGNAGLANCRGLVRGCVIFANNGDGVYDHAGDVKNCLISGNLKNGLYFWKSYGCNMTNCTIVGNKLAGAAFLPTTTWNARFPVRNSIVALNGTFGVSTYDCLCSMKWYIDIDYVDAWGNTAGAYAPAGSSRQAELVIGVHSISEDPLFGKRGSWDTSMVWHEGDYHLKSKLGRWDTRTMAWVTDPVDSPCLDRGDPKSAFLDEPYPNGGRINMGAYGGTAEASMSPGGVTCLKYPEMDFNHDCKVDQADLDIFLQHWLECNLSDPNACWPQGAPSAPRVQR